MTASSAARSGEDAVAPALDHGAACCHPAPQRINTIIDYEAVQRLGVQGQVTHTIFAALAIPGEATALVGDGSREIPIARAFLLDQVRDAYRELAECHSHCKIVLLDLTGVLQLPALRPTAQSHDSIV